MIYRNNVIFSFLILFIAINSKADFFAFQKLVHTDTKKIVYLLYDTHASIVADSSVAEKIMKDVNLIISDPGKRTYSTTSIGARQVNIQIPWEENEEIKAKLA